MTDPDQKPVISDDEVRIFRRFLNMHPEYTVGERECMKQALSAFLSARVPEAENAAAEKSDSPMMLWKQGFNACRDVVMKGRGA